MHDPVGALTLGSAAPIENEGLLHANDSGGGSMLARLDGAILTSGFPVTSISCPVGPMPIWILPVNGTEEEPLRIPRLDYR